MFVHTFSSSEGGSRRHPPTPSKSRCGPAEGGSGMGRSKELVEATGVSELTDALLPRRERRRTGAMVADEAAVWLDCGEATNDLIRGIVDKYGLLDDELAVRRK